MGGSASPSSGQHDKGERFSRAEAPQILVHRPPRALHKYIPKPVALSRFSVCVCVCVLIVIRLIAVATLVLFMC